MVQSDTRDARDDGPRGTRGVPAAAESNLEHRGVDARLGEDDAGGHREQVELRDAEATLARALAAGVRAPARLGREGDAARECLARDGRTRDLHALAHLDELGRGVQGA